MSRCTEERPPCETTTAKSRFNRNREWQVQECSRIARALAVMSIVGMNFATWFLIRSFQSICLILISKFVPEFMCIFLRSHWTLDSAIQRLYFESRSMEEHCVEN